MPKWSPLRGVGKITWSAYGAASGGREGTAWDRAVKKIGRRCVVDKGELVGD